MRLKGLNVLICCLLTANITFAESPRQWTLKECIDYSLINNIQLQQKKITKNESSEDVQSAKAQLLPSLSFTTTHQLGYQPFRNNGQNTVTNGYVESAVDKLSYSGSYGINANWTVWNGNKNRNTIKQQQLSELQADLSVTETANSIQEKITQLYVQILYSDEAIKVDEEALKISKNNAKRGVDMVKTGQLAKADLAQLNAQVATDEYNVVNAKSILANYKLQLKQLLELTADDFDVTIPETSDSQALSDIPTISDVYSAALSYRPEIQNATLGIKISDVNIDIAKTGRMPTISLTGTVGASTSSLSSTSWGKQIKTNLNGALGVSVSIPLFDQRSTKTAVNKAKLVKQSQELELQNQQKELYSTIENYWLEANTNQQKFRAAISNVESAQASYDLVGEQFKLGLKNIVELTTSKTNLLTAQQNRLESKYTTILNQQILKFYKEGNINL
jgi:outer membrane protein